MERHPESIVIDRRSTASRSFEYPTRSPTRGADTTLLMIATGRHQPTSSDQRADDVLAQHPGSRGGRSTAVNDLQIPTPPGGFEHAGSRSSTTAPTSRASRCLLDFFGLPHGRTALFVSALVAVAEGRAWRARSRSFVHHLRIERENGSDSPDCRLTSSTTRWSRPCLPARYLHVSFGGRTRRGCG